MGDDLSTAADLHSHLVPGVDDGARTVDDALEGIGRMIRAGVGAIVTTPHLQASVTLDRAALDRRMAVMDRGWTRVSEAVADAWPDLIFRRGFEVRLDIPDPDLSDERIRMAGTRWILVEWDRMQVPPGTAAVLERFAEAGLRPLIAHPERYSGTRERVAEAREWRARGAFLQVNLGSLVGRYGNRARTRALRLLREGLVDVLATDFHGRPQLELFLEPVAERLRRLGAHEHLTLLTSTNPHRILDDQVPLIVPPLPAEGGLWGRVKELFQMSGQPG